jgi:photosystem II stability/assembly factor-like uncharacterized protein
MRKYVVIIAFCIAALFAAEKSENNIYSGLKFRSVGPAVFSGRISDLAVNPENISEYYVAVASGGVWKTTNRGITFIPIFDSQGSYSIGCVALDPANPHVVWVGTGENNSQRSVSYGDGIYRSRDGGKTWKNMGLKKSEHIAKIVFDPTDSNTMYVAAQGPLWGPGGDRGLYKTTDGGKTWQKSLYISENTGVTDVVMDPRDSNVLYAATYQRRRHVWTLLNGGPESAVHKTTDGGKTWEKLKGGLPGGDVGRIGLAMAPANPDIIYAIVEASPTNSGFYRSTNRGASWEKRSNHISNSPQYYQEIVVDPTDENYIYSLNTYTMISKDGGKSFSRLSLDNRHVDDHALWINPADVRHVLIGGDGGIYESFDRGKTWDFKQNLPVTQLYRVGIDNAEPFYKVYGGTQDNFSFGGPSQTTAANGIVNADWFVTKGGDGFKTVVDPTNADIIYAQSQYGWLARYDHKSGERLGIKPVDEATGKPLKWNWDSPIVLSPHNSDRLYFGANKLFRSDDKGQSWTVVSPDLTRQIDRNKLKIMGRVWSVDAIAKNKSTSFYGTLVALDESPLTEGLLYTGSDDGLIQRSDDGGKKWVKIDDYDLPEYVYVSCVIASAHKNDRVYASFDNHKMADFKPYLLMSDNKGKSWKNIAGNLPKNGTVWEVAEDPEVENLLFAGTEFGVFFTYDYGKNWQQLKAGLPTIAVKDIEIQKREKDLVMGTFGRGIYILDDIQSLRDLAKNADILTRDAHIFPVQDALLYMETYAGTGHLGSNYYQASNPPFGATISYYLKSAPKTKKAKRQEQEKALKAKKKDVFYPTWEELEEEALEEKPYLLFVITDAAGNVVRQLKKTPKEGVNRITWDLKYPQFTAKDNLKSDDQSSLPVMPGKYSVQMTMVKNGVEQQIGNTAEFNVKLLRNATLQTADVAELHQFHQKIMDVYRKLYNANRSIDHISGLMPKIEWALINTPANTSDLRATAVQLKRQIAGFKKQLNGNSIISRANEPVLPGYLDRLQTIYWEMFKSTSAPTDTHRKSLAIALEGLNNMAVEVEQTIAEKFPKLQKDMMERGCPWTPGSIPVF